MDAGAFLHSTLAEVDILRDLMCPGGLPSHQTFSLFTWALQTALFLEMARDVCVACLCVRSHRLIHRRGALCNGVNLLCVVKCLSTTF